jgi:hypothetical protein
MAFLSADILKNELHRRKLKQMELDSRASRSPTFLAKDDTAEWAVVLALPVLLHEVLEVDNARLLHLQRVASKLSQPCMHIIDPLYHAYGALWY